MPVALHASDGETDEFTDTEPTVRQRLDNGDVAGRPRRPDVARWGSGSCGEKPLDLVGSERQHFAG